MTASERTVLQRVAHLDHGLGVHERELRYQLNRRDDHPLAQTPELLDLLADLEDMGLVRAELSFVLTDRGRQETA